MGSKPWTNVATTPSPVWLNRNPSYDSISVRSTSSCASSAAGIASASVSHRRVEPSISVNKKVTTPEGGPPADTRTECHTKAGYRGQLRLTFETLVSRLFQDTGVRAVFVPRRQVGRDYTLRCIR